LIVIFLKNWSWRGRSLTVAASRCEVHSCCYNKMFEMKSNASYLGS
jgi:hypothetical protein